MDGSVQYGSNCSGLAMELLQSCTKPVICLIKCYAFNVHDACHQEKMTWVFYYHKLFLNDISVLA